MVAAPGTDQHDPQHVLLGRPFLYAVGGLGKYVSHGYSLSTPQPGEPLRGFMASRVPSRSSADARPARTMAQRSSAPPARADRFATRLMPLFFLPETTLTASSARAASSVPAAPANIAPSLPLSKGPAASPNVATYPA